MYIYIYITKLYMTCARDPKKLTLKAHWQEAPGRDIMASGETREAPGGSPRPPGLQRRFGAKVCQNHCVLSTKVARPSVLAESGEGDTHDPRSLRTKVGGRTGGTEPKPQPLTQKTIRQNPFSVNTVWGIYI